MKGIREEIMYKDESAPDLARPSAGRSIPGDGTPQPAPARPARMSTTTRLRLIAKLTSRALMLECASSRSLLSLSRSAISCKRQHV